MPKPLDPMSVRRTETPSVSYVLRRRYGPSRHIIAVASWVTVINMLLQPVAVWAGTWSTINWTGDSVLPLSSNIEYTAAVDFNNTTAGNYTTYGAINGVQFQLIPNDTTTGVQNYAPSGTTLGSWEIKTLDSLFVSNTDNLPSGTASTALNTYCAYRTASTDGPDIALSGLTADTDYIFTLYAPVLKGGAYASRGLSLTPSDTGTPQSFTQGTTNPQIIRYQYTAGSPGTFTMNVGFLNATYPGIFGAFANEMPSFKYWDGGNSTWDTGTTASFGQRASGSPSLRAFTTGKDAIFAAGTPTVSVAAGGVTAGTMQITGGSPTFTGGAISATTLRASGTASATFNNSSVTAGTADFVAATGGSTVLNTGSAGKLNVTTKMDLSGGVRISGSFAVTGTDIANDNADRTITLNSVGTVTMGNRLTDAKAFYTFDGGNTTNLGSTGAPNKGTLEGSATVVNGVGLNGGYALKIDDNTSQRMNIGTLTPSTPKVYTASAWFNGLHDNGQYRVLFRSGDAGTDYAPLLIGSGSDNLGYWGGSLQQGSPAFSMVSYATGWHMVSVVANGIKSDYYVDGVYATTVNDASAQSSPFKYIGNSGGTAMPFAQYLDSVSIYDKALTATEVQSLYNAGGNSPTTKIDLQKTHINAMATSTLNLGDSAQDHKLGNFTVTAGSGADTTLTVSNAKSLTIGTLTIGINGKYYGKLDLGAKTLTLGNGSVTKLAVTTASSAVTTAITVAVAAHNSFTGLNGYEVTDDNNKKWTVTVVDMGNGKDELRLNPPSGTLILFN